MIKKTKKIDQLVKKYNEMKVVPLIIHGSGAGWLFWNTVAMIIPAYVFMFRLLWTGDLINLLGTWVFVVPGIVTHLLAVAKSNKYVRTDPKFSPYRSQFKLRRGGFSYDSFLTEYRFYSIKKELRQLKYDAHIDDVICILESDGSKIFDYMWKPVVILGAILFPVIGEYVGYRYNVTLQANSKELEGLTSEEVSRWIRNTNTDGIGTLLDLLPLMIFTGVFVWLLVFLIEKLFLTKVSDRKNLIKLLKQIKMN